MEDHRDRRLTEAADLRKSIDSLLKVPSEHRTSFVHDRLMTAIDSSCAKHKSTRDVFSTAQILILKDVCFNIIHVLDPKNNEKKGFVKAIWSEWKIKSPLTKLTTFFGAMIVVVPLSISWGQAVFPYFMKLPYIRDYAASSHYPTQAIPDETFIFSSKPFAGKAEAIMKPAASTPSTPATPDGGAASTQPLAKP